MPFTSPMLFGSSISFDAVIEFAGQSDAQGGTGNARYNPNSITIISDPNNYFGTVVTHPNYKYVPFNTFGDYEFTVLSNYSSSNIDSALVETYFTGGSIDLNQTIVDLTSGTTILSPSPVTKTMTNNSSDDGLSVQIAASFDQREVVGSCKIGIKKL